MMNWFFTILWQNAAITHSYPCEQDANFYRSLYKGVCFFLNYVIPEGKKPTTWQKVLLYYKILI